MTMSYYPDKYDVFIGVDVDKGSFSITVKDRNSMSRSKKMPSNPEQFYKYIQNQFMGEQILCAYESGPTGFGLYDYLRSKNQECMVVSPFSIPKASNDRVKNNRIDSNRLSHLLMSGQLKSIRVPEPEYRELRHLIQLRENYIENIKTAKQRVKSLLLYEGLQGRLKEAGQKWSNNYINQIREIECSLAVRQRLDMLLMDLEYARKQMLIVLRQLRVFCKREPEIQRNIRYLQSIPGIGFIIATTVLGRIGNPQHLSNIRELAAFVGLIPTERSTGDVVNHGSITHLGNKILRALLIEGAWVAIRRDTQLKQFYHRISGRHHPRIGPRKAIVGVARKLTQRIYRVLKEQRPYIVH